MSNYYGAARTNYFRVKNAARFKKWAAKHQLEIIHDDKDPSLLALLPGPMSEGTFPGGDAETGEDFDLMGALGKHLRPGEIAVHMESGHEKSKYVTGIAEAVNHKGETVSLSLREIYERAKAKFGKMPTACEY